MRATGRRRHALARIVRMREVAASLGFEPRQRDPESLVLPLHHEATSEKNKDRCALLQVARSGLRVSVYAAAIFFGSSKISLPCWPPETSKWLPFFVASSRADSIIASIIASS